MKVDRIHEDQPSQGADVGRREELRDAPHGLGLHPGVDEQARRVRVLGVVDEAQRGPELRSERVEVGGRDRHPELGERRVGDPELHRQVVAHEVGVGAIQA